MILWAISPRLPLLLLLLPLASSCRLAGDRCYVKGGSAGVNKSSCCGDMPGPPRSTHAHCNSTQPMLPSSVCVGPPPPAPSPPRPCAPERLHNGIELACPWPPRRPFVASSAKGLIEPPAPDYLAEPPAVRDISVGRSLLIDDFLVDLTGSQGVQRTFFAAEYLEELNPVITFDKPWEKIGNTYARPFSGGVMWHEPSQRYRMYYGCGDSVSDDSNLALCLATSVDGLKWEKPNQPVVPNTNIVINTPLRSNNVWDAGTNATDPSRRYVLADTNGPEAPGSSYWLWASPDGVHWKPRRNTTGMTSDRGTFFRDPFRNKWVFSIKGYTSAGAVYGRHRMYWETAGDDPFAEGPGPPAYAPSAFPTVNRFCMAFLYTYRMGARVGRFITTQNGGFWPGQMSTGVKPTLCSGLLRTRLINSVFQRTARTQNCTPSTFLHMNRCRLRTTPSSEGRVSC
jgi:hypothetical protein